MKNFSYLAVITITAFVAGCCEKEHLNRLDLKRLAFSSGYGRVKKLDVLIGKTVPADAVIQPIEYNTGKDSLILTVSFDDVRKKTTHVTYYAMLFPDSRAWLDYDGTFHLLSGAIYIDSEPPSAVVSSHPVDDDIWIYVRAGDRVDAGAEGSAMYARTSGTASGVFFVKAMHWNMFVDGVTKTVADKTKYYEVGLIASTPTAKPLDSQLNSDLEAACQAGFQIPQLGHNCPPP